MPRPNVLFLMSDQHRAMSTGAYGSTEVLTPHLDAFAARSARFERAYCTYPQCVAARQSMITGQYPTTHGCDAIAMKTIDYSQWTLQRGFTDAGYHTVLVGHPHFNETGFVEHRTYKPYFENELTDEQREAVLRCKQNPYVEAAKYAGPEDDTEPFRSATYTREAAIDFLRNRPPDKPFFAWVTFQKPHPPFNPPSRFWDLYDPSTFTLPPTDPNRPRHEFWPEWIMAEPMVRNYLHGYYASISYMDWCMGEILAEAERQGLFDNTIIMYTSDHGDSAGAHGKYEKHCFFEDSVHIPWMIHTPGCKPRVVEELVEHVDLAPTLLDMCDIDRTDRCFQGDSLTGLLNGSADGWKNRAISEYRNRPSDTFGRMLVRGDFKCCIEGNMPSPGSLFNLRADPDEFVNLWDDPDHEVIRDQMVAEMTEDWPKWIYQPPETDEDLKI